MTAVEPTEHADTAVSLPRTHPPERAATPVRGYTVEQVAEMLQVGRDKVFALLRTGQLRSLKIGRSRRITDQHLAEFVSSLEQAS